MRAACGRRTARSGGEPNPGGKQRRRVPPLKLSLSRRFAHSELWQEFFHVLLNIPGCSSLPSLARLRGQLALVLQQSCSHSKLGSLRSRLLVQLLERRKAAAR